MAVRFHSIEPWAGFLLLPFLGYSVFGAALLNLSLHSGNAEASDTPPVACHNIRDFNVLKARVREGS